MSKEQDLQVADLESAETVAPTTKKEKVLTAEEIQALTDASQKIREFGVSADFDKVLTLVPNWHNSDAVKEAKDAVIESFGGSEKFKDYIDGPFQKELAVIAGLSKVASTLNNIKSFYARRESTKKAKTSQVNIGGEFYEVDAEYLASLSEVTGAEKRELLLAHAGTKKNESIEIL